MTRFRITLELDVPAFWQRHLFNDKIRQCIAKIETVLPGTIVYLATEECAAKRGTTLDIVRGLKP